MPLEHLTALDSRLGPMFEPEASPSVLYFIFVLFPPFYHSTWSKTSPLSKHFAFDASLFCVVVGFFIHRLLCGITSPMDFGVFYDKLLS